MNDDWDRPPTHRRPHRARDRQGARWASSTMVDLSDAYFRKLAYVDISSVKSYCPGLSDRAMKYYLFAGFVLFYVSNYLFRPLRGFRTMVNLVTGNHTSRGEMALAQLFGRIKAVLVG